MFLDDKMSGGGGFSETPCLGCKQPIRPGEKTTRIAFDHDPTGARGLTGEYHAQCGRKFGSLANAMKVLGRWPG